MQTSSERELEPCGILMLSLSGALYHFALPSANLLWVKNLTAKGEYLVDCQESTKFNAETQYKNAQPCEECHIMSSKNWLVCVNSEHKNEIDNIIKEDSESSYHEEQKDEEEQEQEEEKQIYKSSVRLQNVKEHCNCTITTNWRIDNQTSVDSHLDNYHECLEMHEPSIEESVQRWNEEHATQEQVRLLCSKEQEFYEVHLHSGQEKNYLNSSGICRTRCEEKSSKERSVTDSETTFLQIMQTTYKHNLFRHDTITGKQDTLRFRSTKVEISIEQPTFYRNKRRETNINQSTYHEQECETSHTNVNTNTSKTLLGSSVNVNSIVCTSNGALYDNNKQIITPLIDASHDCVVWCALILQSFEKTNIVTNSDLDKDQMTTTHTIYSLRIVPVHASHSTDALCNRLAARHVNANKETKSVDNIILINENKQESQNDNTNVIEKQNVLRIVIKNRQYKNKTLTLMHDTSNEQELSDYSKEERSEFHSKSEEQEEEEQESLKEEEEESEVQETLESPLYELPSMSGRTFSGTDQRSSELNNTSTNKSGSDMISKTIISGGESGGSPWAVVTPHLVTEETVASFFDDNFEPIQVLGKGASGAALLVRHHATGFLYAIKVFIARDYESERHILQETRLHAFLQHRHLVRYHVSWSEVVTRKRAQELAQIGLCHPEEAEVLPIQYASELLSSEEERSLFQSNTDNTKSECTNYKMELNSRPLHKSIIGSRVIFLQMELCQRTLKSYLEERTSVDRVENMVIFLQIVSGVRYMHRMHLVHRDIKANNIFLDYRCQLAPANTLRADDESDDDDEEDSSTTNINSSNNDSQAELYDKESDEREESALTVEENWPLTTFCIAHEGINQPRWQIGPPLMSYGRHCIQLSTKSPFTHIASLTNNNKISKSYKNSGNNNVSVVNQMENSELEVDNCTENDDNSNNNTLLDACDNIHHCSANDVIREAIEMYAAPHSHSNINKTNQRAVLHDSRNGSGAANNGYNSNDAVNEKNVIFNKLSLDESKWSRVLRWVQRRLVQVRIGDFGLSKFLNYNQHSVLQSDKIENCESDSSESSDSVNHVNTKGVGTPLYASPEQLAGMMCTSASDVFSLGVLFTEMYIEPTTQSERIILLQRVRQGTFPDSAMLARYPELAIVPQLTRLCPQERMTLDKVHIILYNILL